MMQAVSNFQYWNAGGKKLNDKLFIERSVGSVGSAKVARRANGSK
jgi:hypothetical protein